MQPGTLTARETKGMKKLSKRRPNIRFSLRQKKKPHPGGRATGFVLEVFVKKQPKQARGRRKARQESSLLKQSIQPLSKHAVIRGDFSQSVPDKIKLPLTLSNFLRKKTRPTNDEWGGDQGYNENGVMQVGDFENDQGGGGNHMMANTVAIPTLLQSHTKVSKRGYPDVPTNALFNKYMGTGDFVLQKRRHVGNVSACKDVCSLGADSDIMQQHMCTGVVFYTRVIEDVIYVPFKRCIFRAKSSIDDAHKLNACLMLWEYTPELHRQFEFTICTDIIQEP
ncbi:hypothetical protein Tco_0278067 [Tanacetum coccineum]